MVPKRKNGATTIGKKTGATSWIVNRLLIAACAVKVASLPGKYPVAVVSYLRPATVTLLRVCQRS